MRENFLHYLWKHKKFEIVNLKTQNGESIVIKSVGTHNLNSGPDFFNAQLLIDEQHWAGNVEIHLKSSHWYKHNHEIDENYDNVILHVVWQFDIDVFRKNGSVIPVLVLKDAVSESLLRNYYDLHSKKEKWINCENDIAFVNNFTVSNWLERLYFERLERKALEIELLLQNSNYDWEAVLFKLLTKNFGLKINSDAFLSLANSFDFSLVRKLQSKILNIEALFLGQGGLLKADRKDAYYISLKNEYHFMKQKYQLNNEGVFPLQFFRLRPANFPTLRLAQLASLYTKRQSLFSNIIQINKVEELYKLFAVSTSKYWETHYNFDKSSNKTIKKVTKPFIDLLVINTIIPLKFSFAKSKDLDINETIVQLISKITAENNSIIKKFNLIKLTSNSALQSQAIIELKSNYCDKNKCLQCAIGNQLLERN